MARAECAEAVTATLEQRTAARRAKGKSGDGLSISPIEPEAVVQPQKNKKTFAPSDKPSILANEARVVVAWQIDPSSELTPVKRRSVRISGNRQGERV